MWWRIVSGFIRIVFGFALLKIVGTPMMDVLNSLMSYEFIADSSDILYSTLSNLLGQSPQVVSYFLAGYFIFWGIIDVVISYNMLKDRMWAFPVGLVLVGGFIFYEIVRVSYTHSPILLVAIAVDLLIFALTAREYRKILALRKVPAVVPVTVQSTV